MQTHQLNRKIRAASTVHQRDSPRPHTTTCPYLLPYLRPGCFSHTEVSHRYGSRIETNTERYTHPWNAKHFSPRPLAAYTNPRHLNLNTNHHPATPTLFNLPHVSKSPIQFYVFRRCTGDSKYMEVLPNSPFPVSVFSISLLHNPLPLQDLHTEVSHGFRPTNLDDERATAQIRIFHRRDDFPFPSLPSLPYIST